MFILYTISNTTKNTTKSLQTYTKLECLPFVRFFKFPNTIAFVFLHILTQYFLSIRVSNLTFYHGKKKIYFPELHRSSLNINPENAKMYFHYGQMNTEVFVKYVQAQTSFSVITTSATFLKNEMNCSH